MMLNFCLKKMFKDVKSHLSLTKKDEFDRYEFGSCIILNISYYDLPQWIIKKNKCLYDAVKYIYHEMK